MTPTVKGFQDFSGEEARKRTKIKKILAEAFERFGFEPAETPIIETKEFVKGDNKQDGVISDIFGLRDKGKRALGLRYEFTFQLKRLMQNKKLPYRRYQIGEVFRDEPISSNRFRQFTQCDIDIIGSNEKSEAEVLATVKDVLDKLNIKFTIYVNNRELLNDILRENKIKNKDTILREIDKLDKLSEKQVISNLRKLKAGKILTILKKPESYFKKYPSYVEIKKLKQYCKYYGVDVTFKPTLARGLSYYNGNVFEVKANKMKETVCAGGSYIFNKVQATGISFGLERLSNLSKIKQDPAEKYLVISLKQDRQAIQLIKKLRKKNKDVTIFYGKPSKALEYANSYGYNKAVFVGEREVKSKKFKVKDMSTGKEKYIVY